jgi:hypothetical protein
LTASGVGIDLTRVIGIDNAHKLTDVFLTIRKTFIYSIPISNCLPMQIDSIQPAAWTQFFNHYQFIFGMLFAADHLVD